MREPDDIIQAETLGALRTVVNELIEIHGVDMEVCIDAPHDTPSVTLTENWLNVLKKELQEAINAVDGTPHSIIMEKELRKDLRTALNVSFPITMYGLKVECGNVKRFKIARY